MMQISFIIDILFRYVNHVCTEMKFSQYNCFVYSAIIALSIVHTRI